MLQAPAHKTQGYWRPTWPTWATFTSFQIKGHGWFPVFSVLQALAILSNTLIHPSHPGDLHPNIQVAFLPPPQLCNRQPEERLLTLKRFIYSKHWCNYLEWWTRQTRHWLSKFWKSFNIWHVLENVLAARDSITSKTINGVWKAVRKGHTHSSEGSEEEDGVAQRVSLGWKAAFDEREEMSIQESYLRLNLLKKSRGRERRWYKCGTTVNS